MCSLFSKQQGTTDLLSHGVVVPVTAADVWQTQAGSADNM